MSHITKLFLLFIRKNGICEHKIDRTDLDHLMEIDVSHLEAKDEEARNAG